MSQFQSYSQYYDLLYKEKDYKKEADFVQQVIKKHSPHKVKSILSLGCGTCSYELLFAQKGYQIKGLDISADMLKIAQQKIKKAKQTSRIEVQKVDIRKFRLPEQYDFAMSLFNVMGYQIKNQDMEQVLANVYQALKPGGLFAFDCWYLPAVLKDRPTDRIRVIQDKKNRTIRLTNSQLQVDKDTIKIHFHVMSLENKTLVAETEEDHYMRYWSLPSLQYFLEKAGFSLKMICNFGEFNSSISEDNWNIFVVAAKQP